MVEYIKEQDSLNTGRITINKELTRSNNNADKAKIDSAEALLKAIASMDLSESVRNQLNQIVIEGDSSVEAAAARVDEKNVTHDTLKERIDDGFLGVTSQLNETENELTEVNTRFAKGNLIRLPTPLKERRALNVFVDDDGHSAVLTKLKPLSEQYGVPFTLGLISSHIENPHPSRLTAKQAKQLQDGLGWEMASHEYNHISLDGESDEVIYQEIVESQRHLRSYGLDIKNLVYPYGSHNKKIRELASTVYNCAVSTRTGTNIPPIDTFALRREQFPVAGKTLSHYKTIVDNAIANDELLIWMLHCGQTEHNEQAQQILEDLIIYMNQKGLESVTLQQAMDIYGNEFSFNENELYVGADGSNNIRDLIYTKTDTQTGRAQYNCDTLPKDFPDNKVTITTLHSSTDVQSTPNGRKGRLVTYRGMGNGIVQQEFFSRRETYYRQSEDGDNQWSDWFRHFLGEEFEFTEDFGTIPSMGSASKRIVNTKILSRQYVSVTPVTLIINEGLMISHMITNNNRLNVVLFNPTNNAINVGEVTFKVLFTRPS